MAASPKTLGDKLSQAPVRHRGLLAGLWSLLRRTVGLRVSHRRLGLHALLRNDQQGFMTGLRLAAKTAVIDGSNIYHLGHDAGLDAAPLGQIMDALRTDGYRVVCFFDANIYFVLSAHGAFPASQRHQRELLEDIFGLDRNEIYVVPGGVQADAFILECLDQLPLSFAVTNDRFRDYESIYPGVLGDGQWRKGVTISGGEIHLFRHKFRKPLRTG